MPLPGTSEKKKSQRRVSIAVYSPRSKGIELNEEKHDSDPGALRMRQSTVVRDKGIGLPGLNPKLIKSVDSSVP